MRLVLLGILLATRLYNHSKSWVLQLSVAAVMKYIQIQIQRCCKVLNTSPTIGKPRSQPHSLQVGKILQFGNLPRDRSSGNCQYYWQRRVKKEKRALAMKQMASTKLLSPFTPAATFWVACLQSCYDGHSLPPQTAVPRAGASWYVAYGDINAASCSCLKCNAYTIQGVGLQLVTACPNESIVTNAPPVFLVIACWLYKAWYLYLRSSCAEVVAFLSLSKREGVDWHHNSLLYHHQSRQFSWAMKEAATGDQFSST